MTDTAVLLPVFHLRFVKTSYAGAIHSVATLREVSRPG